MQGLFVKLWSFWSKKTSSNSVRLLLLLYNKYTVQYGPSSRNSTGVFEHLHVDQYIYIYFTENRNQPMMGKPIFVLLFNNAEANAVTLECLRLI